MVFHTVVSTSCQIQTISGSIPSMDLPPDEPFTPGRHAFFYGCVGFLLLFLLQVVALGLGVAPITVGAIVLTLLSGAVLTTWLGAIVVRGARGAATALHVVLGCTHSGQRFLWSLGLTPFPMLLFEYEIWTAVGSATVGDVTGLPVAGELIMAVSVLLVVGWLLGVTLLWYQATAVGRSALHYCLQCGHAFSNSTQEQCTECGCYGTRSI